MSDEGAAAGPPPGPARSVPPGTLPLAASAAPLLTAAVLAFRDGGYFVTSWGVAAMVLWAMVATAFFLCRIGDVGLLGVAAAGGWLALGFWQGISAGRADEPAAALGAMNLTLLYGGAFILVLLAARGGSTLRRLLELALLGALAVTLAALAARLLPAIGADEVRSRLSTPISYWNNLALVFAFGFTLALGIAADATRHAALRAAAAATMPAFPLGILFAQSRGAALVMLVGAAATLALARGRLLTVWMLVTGLGASVVLMLYANDQRSLRLEHVLQEDHAAAGRRVAVALVVAAAVCAGAALAVPLVVRLTGDVRRSRAIGAAVAGVAVIAAVAAVVVAGPDEGPVSWADSQLESFKTYDPAARDDATTVADRLAVAAGSGRWQNWTVSAEEFREAPLVGTGAGDFRFRWASERPVDLDVRNAHSLYLEILGESGLIGLALLLAPLALVGAGVARALRRRPPPPLARDLGVASAAGLVVAVAMIGDWGWQMPAVVLPAVALGAAALKAAAVECGDAVPLPSWSAWPLAALAVVALLFVAAPTAGAHREGTARDLAVAGRLQDALGAAGDAAALDPSSPGIATLRANILDDLGRAREADAAFADAVALSPHDWTIRAAWASALLRRGDRPAARVVLTGTRALNPLDERLAGLRRAVRG